MRHAAIDIQAMTRPRQGGEVPSTAVTPVHLDGDVLYDTSEIWKALKSEPPVFLDLRGGQVLFIPLWVKCVTPMGARCSVGW